ncbi:hypothetical protein OHA18_19355 [Kribbella sp. NBC_00709]|uniref:hypothetical protein n=1 Tax=Kribbella sp. NBC_00709 TaxID=2975972 RepID=UPI002E2A4ABF|nr:hypothetical protein [Kribbella sp. NBC_00709]
MTLVPQLCFFAPTLGFGFVALFMDAVGVASARSACMATEKTNGMPTTDTSAKVAARAERGL